MFTADSDEISLRSHENSPAAGNHRLNKPAEQIAKHVDRLMRHGQRDMSDAAFEVFRTICHRALAKRLLLERNASDDFENAMAQKPIEI